MKKYKEKYRPIYLTFLIVLSFILTNYRNNIVIENDYEENNLSYFISYSKYNLDKDYVYVKDDTDIEIQNNVKIVSYETRVEGDMLNFYNFDILSMQFKIVRLNLGNLTISNNNIIIENNIDYFDFISNITTNATYKIFANETEISSGEIKPGMTLKVYYESNEIDSYNIVNDYLNIYNLNIKNDKYIVRMSSKVSSIRKNIDTNGNITFTDPNGKVLEDSDNLTTNTKVKIELSDKIYEYIVVIIGDITGSGDIHIGDISKLYNYYKNTIEMEECYIMAGDVTFDNIIEINDISKLYQYYKGTIDSL